MKFIKRFTLLTVLLFLVAACSNDNKEDTETNKESDKSLTPVSFILDWTPNTNHTGLYVAKEKGYFEEVGLDVDILLPGEVSSAQLVTAGQGHFGISYQEEMIQARSEGLSVVSIGAVIQNNTAGYASPADKGIKTPKDFENKVYGAYGTETEELMLNHIMSVNDANYDDVETVLLGNSDFFAATARDIDFVSIFYGWTGIEAEIRDVDLNIIYLKDFADELNMYAPVIFTSEQIIEEDPELVEKFMSAVSKGYEFTIENPTEAAEILIDAEPELDPELVMKSSEWLAPLYKEDAEQWGIQELERWETVIDFFFENEMIKNDIDANEAFTNEFLPNNN